MTLNLGALTLTLTLDPNPSQFHAGEPLEGLLEKEWNNPHSGSMFTAKINGRSLYGLINNFVRVVCRVTGEVREICLVSWFAPPKYPDGDPLLVRISLDEDPPVHCNNFLFLNEIDPTPVIYEIVERNRCMFMMRMRGLDVLPTTN